MDAYIILLSGWKADGYRSCYHLTEKYSTDVLGIVMIDHAVLDKAAELYAELRASGQLIEDADLLIAAIALVHDMTLVTNNAAHFTQITGLQIEDWLNS